MEFSSFDMYLTSIGPTKRSVLLFWLLDITSSNLIQTSLPMIATWQQSQNAKNFGQYLETDTVS